MKVRRNVLDKIILKSYWYCFDVAYRSKTILVLVAVFSEWAVLYNFNNIVYMKFFPNILTSSAINYNMKYFTSVYAVTVFIYSSVN